jgi:hypothetical protein
MDMKRLAIGTIVGGITLFVAGYLIFDLATANFYAESLIDVDSAYRDAPVQWMQALGNLLLGALVTLGIMSRPGVPTIAGGFAIGALIGFLAWGGADFTLVALTNVWTPTIVLIDPLFEAIHHGTAGAVIAAVLARIPSSAMRPAE